DPANSPHDVDVTASLVVQARILPILDGFDELPERVLPTAVCETNRVLTQGAPLVVVSRKGGYRSAVDRSAQLAGQPMVVEIGPADVNAVTGYLLAGSREEQARWQPVVKHMRTRPRSLVARVLSSPLMCAMASKAYHDPATRPHELLTFRRRVDLEQHLISAF